jgi:hypothetical protein
MGNREWGMGNGEWEMGKGERGIEDGGMDDGRWGMGQEVKVRARVGYAVQGRWYCSDQSRIQK